MYITCSNMSCSLHPWHTCLDWRKHVHDNHSNFNVTVNTLLSQHTRPYATHMGHMPHAVSSTSRPWSMDTWRRRRRTVPLLPHCQCTAWPLWRGSPRPVRSAPAGPRTGRTARWSRRRCPSWPRWSEPPSPADWTSDGTGTVRAQVTRGGSLSKPAEIMNALKDVNTVVYLGRLVRCHYVEQSLTQCGTSRAEHRFLFL